MAHSQNNRIKTFIIVPIKRTYVSTLDGLGEDVSFIDKPPHLQSRVPLRRIPVRIAAAVTTPIVEDGAADSTSDMDLESPTEESIVDLSFIEKADLSPESIDKPLLDSPKSSISFQKSNKELENTAIKSDQQLLIRPNTSAEFYREWKSKGTALARFPYLRVRDTFFQVHAKHFFTIYIFYVAYFCR